MKTTPQKPVKNPDFETGNDRPWEGEGEVVKLPDGNFVYEMEAKKAGGAGIKQAVQIRADNFVTVVSLRYRVMEGSAGIEIFCFYKKGSSVETEKTALINDGKWHEVELEFDRSNYFKVKPQRGRHEVHIHFPKALGIVQVDDVILRVW